MIQLRIVIETVNSAFDDYPHIECARILREIADRLESTGIPSTPLDINGNKCGSVTVEG